MGLTVPTIVERLVSRLRSYRRGWRSRSAIEAEMAEEFQHHLELRAEELERRGLPAKEAVRQARLEFGSVESLKEEARASRGLSWFDQLRFSWLDVRVAFRMLGKYPGLTVVAIFALAIGIPVGLAPVHLAQALRAPLPEDDHDRIRAVRVWDPLASRSVPANAEQLELWRDELPGFTSMGGFRAAEFNVALEGGRAQQPAAGTTDLESSGSPETGSRKPRGSGTSGVEESSAGESAWPASGARMTASVFEMLATPPARGRLLVRGDEAPNAPDVAVIGWDLWRGRFGEDPEILGKTLLVDRRPHTIVGVMPDGFHFPTLQQLWVPLRTREEVGTETPVRVIGQLASGATSAEVEAQLAVVGVGRESAMALAMDSDQVDRLLLEVLPFGIAMVGLPSHGLESEPGFWLFRLLAFGLLLVACGNVGMLIFARTATRFEELAIRSALGAGRLRILLQMFVETLVLCLLAAAIGLVSIDWALDQLRAAVITAGLRLPYWLTVGVTPQAVIRALLFALVSALVAGVIPALRVSGRGVQQSIQRARSERSGVRFGGVIGLVLVADIAVAITVVGIATGIGHHLLEVTRSERLAGIDASEYLAVSVRVPLREPGVSADSYDRATFERRLGSTQRRLVEAIEAEPGIRGVGVADRLPRMDHRSRRVEVEGIDGPGGRRARYLPTVAVDVSFFEALEQPILGGRGFDRLDVQTEGVRPVIVNTEFQRLILGGSDPLGRRLRFVESEADAGPWREIVGVVGHLGIDMVNPTGAAGVYVPKAPGEIYPLQLAIHVGGDPQSFTPRLRKLVSEIESTAVLGAPMVLATVYQGDWYLTVAVAGGLGLLVAILVAVAACGLYAIMSFSVEQRTREIGIRQSLGASRAAVAWTVLRRSLLQIGLGALIGTPLAAWTSFELREASSAAIHSGWAIAWGLTLGITVVTIIGLLSCVAPARRALRIQPSEALRGLE